MDIGITTKHAYSMGKNYMEQKIDTKRFQFIREYFDVNNSYILDKIKLILFPFGNSLDFLYKADLYLPLLSLVTLTVVKSMHYGLNGDFHPEKLFMMVSRHLFILLAVSLVYKGCAFVTGIAIPYLALVCFTGYKFIPILLLKSLQLLKFRVVSWAAGLYLLAAYFIFYGRSVKTEISKTDNNSLHLYFVFGTATIELIICVLIMR